MLSPQELEKRIDDNFIGPDTGLEYNLAKYNCEHAAVHMSTGFKISKQLERNKAKKCVAGVLDFFVKEM